MKVLFPILLLLSFAAQAQDLVAYVNSQDAKIYSLKSKGVQDLVVDIESAEVLKQLNEQMIFGKLEHITFRTYWTANPERLAIDIRGLPEGFREVKEELRAAIMPLLENIFPPSTVQRFAGFKFQPGHNPREIIVQDPSGIAPISNFVLKYDSQERLVEVNGKKMIGEFIIQTDYQKESFADGKWVIKSQVTTDQAGHQSSVIKKELTYGTSQGMGVITRIAINHQQKLAPPPAKQLNSEQVFELKNYKINSGAALQFFLGDAGKVTP